MAELSAEVIDFLSAGTRTAMLGYLAVQTCSRSRLGSVGAPWAHIAPRNSASATPCPGELVVRVKPTKVNSAFNIAG
jgi:hypothetical protein